MSNKRWAAQVGLLSAVVVLVASLGILMSQGGDNSRSDNAGQPSSVTASHVQNIPISLSAASADAAASHH